jgi:O-methyltransferase involved in polyketide biosynthesis
VSTETVELAGVKGTLVYTLYFRALDARSKAPIVGDVWAPEVIEVLERTDPGSLRKGLRTAKLGASGRFTPLLRTRRLDDWTRAFLAGHPDATVLHLGCGLDSRAFRIGIPERGHWYDLDYPEVIELRGRVYPERDRYHMIAASAADPGWLDALHADRPALVVAEGLLMYLAEPEVRRLLGGLAGHFPQGELAFDIVGSFTARLNKFAAWVPGDPHELERWNPRLALVEDIPIVSDWDRIPLRRYRVPLRLLDRIPSMRNGLRVLRYRLSPDATPAEPPLG